MRYSGSQNTVTKSAGLWGRLATCGGLVPRLPAFANGRPAPVGNGRAGYHPAPPRPPGVTALREAPYFASSYFFSGSRRIWIGAVTVIGWIRDGAGCKGAISIRIACGQPLAAQVATHAGGRLGCTEPG